MVGAAMNPERTLSQVRQSRAISENRILDDPGSSGVEFQPRKTHVGPDLFFQLGKKRVEFIEITSSAHSVKPIGVMQRSAFS